MTEKHPEINPAGEPARTTYVPTPVIRHEHAEGTLTRIIEQQAAKLPSDFFLFTALGALFASTFFELTGNSRMARFVGLWPPVLLTMGIYNKLVKIMGMR